MAEAQFMSVTPEQLGGIMQEAGYRTEHRADNNGTPLIASATGGISFNVRLGNRAVAPVEGRRLGRHTELGAELARLDKRPVGELLAGQAGREAEVVLDSGRPLGLAPGGDGVQREGGQPL